ncbi:MAG: hypothetical protein LQ351_004914 [Letrouitia transgressa]|nr:MAG: hypothetical protein LQ351_004914 [Letrouitia transgressa]
MPNFNNASSADTIGQSGAAVALTKQAMHPLRNLDLGPELEEISQNTELISIYRQPFFGPQDGSQQGVRTVMMAGSKERGVLDGFWAIERGRLQGLLIKKVLERGGEIYPNKRLERIVKEQSPESYEYGQKDSVKAFFSDGTSYEGKLLVGADGAWSVVRKHIYAIASPTRESVNGDWMPDFQNGQIMHGISCANTDDKTPAMYSVGLVGAGVGSWFLKNNRQMWTVYDAPCAAPSSNVESRAASALADKELSDKWDAQVFTGGYDRASTEALINKYRKVWHPSAGTFGNLFKASEKIVRVGLWQKLFARLGNVHWQNQEARPKECGSDSGVKDGKGNIVLIGDAARVLMPTAGQGAAFAIEDATVLADCLLNNPSASADATSSSGSSSQPAPNFSVAIKEYTKQRLPRYKRISQVASWGAKVSIGSTWFDRFVRDWLAAWLPMQGSSARKKVTKDGKRKDRWWETFTDEEWLIGEKFEVRMRPKN